MHGLIFVTWEKYLVERFGTPFLQEYRNTIGETASTAPLASRVYNDEALLAGVDVASKLARVPTDMLLREYGRFFIANGLTSHLCTYLLAKVNNGRDLLLMMRKAHAQMRMTPDALTPPLFGYEALPTDARGLVLIYDSPRHICSVLLGAIEGAAERYGEQVQVIERTCMNRGAEVCRFEIHFFTPDAPAANHKETPEHIARRNAKLQLAEMVLSALPYHDGVTLTGLQQIMRLNHLNSALLRPSFLLEAIQHLQHAGLIASTANQSGGDDLATRRYWRVLTTGK